MKAVKFLTTREPLLQLREPLPLTVLMVLRLQMALLKTLEPLMSRGVSPMINLMESMLMAEMVLIIVLLI